MYTLMKEGIKYSLLKSWIRDEKSDEYSLNAW